jgi:hypothetical protein
MERAEARMAAASIRRDGASNLERGVRSDVAYLTSISSTKKWSVASGGIGPPGVPRGP